MPTLLTQKGTREVTSVTREHVQGMLFLDVVKGNFTQISRLQEMIEIEI
jgi:hypothetical protein